MTFLGNAVEQIAASALLRRIAGGALWTTFGTLAQRGGLLFVTYLIGRYGGSVLLGRFSFALLTATAAATVAASALGVIATRWVAADLRVAPEYVGGTIKLLYVLTAAIVGFPALICLLAPSWVAVELLHSADMVNALRLIAPLMILAALVILTNSVLFGFEAFPAVACANAVGGLLGTSAAIAGLYANSLEGALFGWTIGVLAQLSIGCIAVARELRRCGLHFGSPGRSLRTMASFGTPLFLGALLVEPVNWLCGTFLLARPGGYAEMGVFQAANQWFLAVIFLPTMLAQANLPVMVELLAQGKRASFVRVTIGTSVATALIGVVVLLCATVFGPFVIAQYGPSFAGRNEVLTLCIATAVLFGLQLPAGNVVVTLGWNWTGLVLNIGWAITFLLSAHYLSASGASGLSLARLIAYAAHVVWTLATLSYLVRVSFTAATPAI